MKNNLPVKYFPSFSPNFFWTFIFILTEVRERPFKATPFTAPFEHHVDVDEQNERRRQPRAFIVLVNQIESLEIPVNVCVFLNHLKGVAADVDMQHTYFPR